MTPNASVITSGIQVINPLLDRDVEELRRSLEEAVVLLNTINTSLNERIGVDSGVISICAETPNDSIKIDKDGHVGIGTTNPIGTLEVVNSTKNVIVNLCRVGAAELRLAARFNDATIGTISNHSVFFSVNNLRVIELKAGGRMVMQLGGGIYNESTGAWVDGSSREYKEQVNGLGQDDADLIMKSLEPVTFKFKTNSDQSDRRAGFIAEDVPELVAEKNRKGLSAMGIVAVLVKVVQDQGNKIDKLLSVKKGGACGI